MVSQGQEGAVRIKNLQGHYIKNTSSWRKIAANAWAKPNDPVIYGRLEIPVRPALRWLAKLNRESDTKITITHFMVKATAETLNRHPECNGFIRRGRIFLRDDIDISVLTAVPPDKDEHEQGADLTEIVIRNADQKTIPEIAQMIVTDARKIRSHHDPFLEKTKRMFQLMPPSVLKRMLALSAYLQYEWNLDLESFGVPRDTFGSAMITSLGMMGIDDAYAPIFPLSRTTLLLAVGQVEDKPLARNGKVVVEPVLPINATVDHRLIDGLQAARLTRTFKEIFADPAGQLAGEKSLRRVA